VPEVPLVPEVLLVPDVPLVVDVPSVPDIALVADVPLVPEVPLVPPPEDDVPVLLSHAVWKPNSAASPDASNSRRSGLILYSSDFSITYSLFFGASMAATVTIVLRWIFTALVSNLSQY
jgi:hypothetical protein